ncbi:hypothetical protein [Paenibacillus faecalis]|uniref:hypothetical protein n=1 Tax=Paenibacillus faecalis TaxID=2079532 RepID=UPI000D106496|nr:hypothetical protein [Paenibacillus faecalis]
MNCKICGHKNTDASFCEKCGTRLASEVVERKPDQPEVYPESNQSEDKMPTSNITKGPLEETETVRYQVPMNNMYTAPKASMPQDRSTPHEHSTPGTAGNEPSQIKPYLESAKKNSKIYFKYFVNSLKSPLAVAQKTGSEQLLNGIISLAIFSILLPLMIYFSFPGKSLMSSPFVDIVLKPVFWIALFMFLIAVYTFGAVKLSTNPKVSLKEIIARFGTLLVPFIVIFLAAFFLLVIGIGMGGLLLTIAMIGSMFSIPVLITLSYKREVNGAMDTMYAILLVYLAIFITFFILGDTISSLMRPGNYFGF